MGDALALMLHHAIHRVVVLEGDEVRACWSRWTCSASLSNHSMLISMRLDLDAVTWPTGSGQITVIGRQFRGGTQTGCTWWAWPCHLRPPGGSSRRPAGGAGCLPWAARGGSSCLKTDQDNGLIWRDGYTPPAELDAICQRFSDELARFRRASWSTTRPGARERTEFTSQTGAPVAGHARGDSLMNLAIFMDAHAVSGDAHLLDSVRQGVMELATDSDAMLARFAAAIDAFASGNGGWWNRLRATKPTAA